MSKTLVTKPKIIFAGVSLAMMVAVLSISIIATRSQQDVRQQAAVISDGCYWNVSVAESNTTSSLPACGKVYDCADDTKPLAGVHMGVYNHDKNQSYGIETDAEGKWYIPNALSEGERYDVYATDQGTIVKFPLPTGYVLPPKTTFNFAQFKDVITTVPVPLNSLYYSNQISLSGDCANAGYCGCNFCYDREKAILPSPIPDTTPPLCIQESFRSELISATPIDGTFKVKVVGYATDDVTGVVTNESGLERAEVSCYTGAANYTWEKIATYDFNSDLSSDLLFQIEANLTSNCVDLLVSENSTKVRVTVYDNAGNVSYNANNSLDKDCYGDIIFNPGDYVSPTPTGSPSPTPTGSPTPTPTGSSTPVAPTPTGGVGAVVGYVFYDDDEDGVFDCTFSKDASGNGTRTGPECYWPEGKYFEDARKWNIAIRGPASTSKSSSIDTGYYETSKVPVGDYSVYLGDLAGQIKAEQYVVTSQQLQRVHVGITADKNFVNGRADFGVIPISQSSTSDKCALISDRADINCDGQINMTDFNLLIGSFTF